MVCKKTHTIFLSNEEICRILFTLDLKLKQL
jgi:hypothetical protein